MVLPEHLTLIVILVVLVLLISLHSDMGKVKNAVLPNPVPVEKAKSNFVKNSKHSFTVEEDDTIANEVKLSERQQAVADAVNNVKYVFNIDGGDYSSEDQQPMSDEVKNLRDMYNIDGTTEL
jgi:Na+-transporting methylmalonyl-CoA/oxaloacetate decarboxylase gamma subunit